MTPCNYVHGYVVSFCCVIEGCSIPEDAKKKFWLLYSNALLQSLSILRNGSACRGVSSWQDAHERNL
jgi:hypothetical protein